MACFDSRPKEGPSWCYIKNGAEWRFTAFVFVSCRCHTNLARELPFPTEKERFDGAGRPACLSQHLLHSHTVDMNGTRSILNRPLGVELND